MSNLCEEDMWRAWSAPNERMHLMAANQQNICSHNVCVNIHSLNMKIHYFDNSGYVAYIRGIHRKPQTHTHTHPLHTHAYKLKRFD